MSHSPSSTEPAAIVLGRLTREIRDAYTAQFGLALFEHAPCAAADLAASLHRHGIHGTIVSGHYDHGFPWPDGPDSPATQHVWIEALGLVIDPTREQWGSDLLMVPMDQATHYRATTQRPF